MAMQRIDVNVFDRYSSLVISIVAATTLGRTDAAPVGSPIATTLEAISLNKGLYQFHGMAVFDLPIRAQSSQGLREDMTGEIGYPNALKDQEPAIVDDPCELSSPELRTPPHPRIPRGDFPRRSFKHQAG